MSQSIHMKTTIFDLSTEKENPINSIYGISLLEWLRVELTYQLIISKPEAEDWGWYSELDYEGNHYLIGSCALLEEGDDPTDEIEWVFQVDKNRSLKEKLFGRNRMSQSDSCFIFFRDFFESYPEIKMISIE